MPLISREIREDRLLGEDGLEVGPVKRKDRSQRVLESTANTTASEVIAHFKGEKRSAWTEAVVNLQKIFYRLSVIPPDYVSQ